MGHFGLSLHGRMVFYLPMTFTQQFLAEVQQVTAQISPDAVERMVDALAAVRERGGRLFILGVGGSVAGFKVVKIEPHQVTFDNQQGRIRVIRFK
jgi:glutamate 5-kinase